MRTVKIGYRRRDKREGPDVYWKKSLVEEKVAVQRLAMLQAVNEPPIASSEEYAGVEVSQGPGCMQVGAGADSGSVCKFAEKESQLEADAGSPATNLEGVAGSPATNQEPLQLEVDAGSPATESETGAGSPATNERPASLHQSPKEVFEGVAAGSPATNQGSGICVVPSQVSEPADVGPEVFEGVAAGSPATNEKPLQASEQVTRPEDSEVSPKVFGPAGFGRKVFEAEAEVSEEMPKTLSCTSDSLRGARSDRH